MSIGYLICMITDVDWDGEHVHVNMGVTIVNSVSGLVSESGRNSLWDVTGL